jgi:hypothetical protein
MGAVFGWLYTTAGEKTPVVVMAREVPVGQVIERADLSTVDVAGAVTAIAGTNLSSAVGQRAAVGLIPGTLLQRGMLTSADPIPAGQVQVGVALKAGQLPADGVHAGDKVAAVRLGGTVAGAGGRRPLFGGRPHQRPVGGRVGDTVVNEGPVTVSREVSS